MKAEVEMPFERVAGICPSFGMPEFPRECSAHRHGSARCTAEIRKQRCLLCRRQGDLPQSFAWPGVGWSFAARRNVQVIRNFTGAGRWLVVVFLASVDRFVDPEFPILAVGSKARALELAFERARQICPGHLIVRSRNGAEDWRCGDLIVAVAEPGR